MYRFFLFAIPGLLLSAVVFWLVLLVRTKEQQRMRRLMERRQRRMAEAQQNARLRYETLSLKYQSRD